jgi:hypothetical protein
MLLEGTRQWRTPYVIHKPVSNGHQVGASLHHCRRVGVVTPPACSWTLLEGTRQWLTPCHPQNSDGTRSWRVVTPSSSSSSRRAATMFVDAARGHEAVAYAICHPQNSQQRTLSWRVVTQSSSSCPSHHDAAFLVLSSPAPPLRVWMLLEGTRQWRTPCHPHNSDGTRSWRVVYTVVVSKSSRRRV